jgi:hypothetical protein
MNNFHASLIAAYRVIVLISNCFHLLEGIHIKGLERPQMCGINQYLLRIFYKNTALIGLEEAFGGSSSLFEEGSFHYV